jgi:hypothetical protein
MLPPVAITANPTNNDSSEYTRKPELNTSLMPMISYNPDQAETVQDNHNQDAEKGRGRRMSEMDMMAAITQLAPELEAGQTPIVQGRRGSRQELHDSVL